MFLISALPVLDGLLSHSSPGSKGKGLSRTEGVDTIDKGETLRLSFNARPRSGDTEAARLMGSSSPRSCKASSAAEGSGAFAHVGRSAGDEFGVGIVPGFFAAGSRACSAVLEHRLSMTTSSCVHDNP